MTINENANASDSIITIINLLIFVNYKSLNYDFIL